MNLAPALLKRITRTLSDVAGFAGDLDGMTVSEETWLSLQATARDARDILTRLPRKAPKKALPEPLRKDARTKRAATHRQATKDLREAAMERAGYSCEAPPALGAQCSGSLQMDHKLPGSGRRRQRQSIETVWILCAWHHHLCTVNKPPGLWKKAKADHCRMHGYSVPPELQ